MSETFAPQIKLLYDRIQVLQGHIQVAMERLSENEAANVRYNDLIANSRKEIEDTQAAMRLLQGAFDSE